jgi:hypothetical protein
MNEFLMYNYIFLILKYLVVTGNIICLSLVMNILVTGKRIMLSLVYIPVTGRLPVTSNLLPVTVY